MLSDGSGGAVDVVAYDSRENSGDFVATSCSVSGLTGGLTYAYQVSARSAWLARAIAAL